MSLGFVMMTLCAVSEGLISSSIIHGVSIHNEAAKFSKTLRSMINDELHISNLQAFYDRLPYEKKIVDPAKELSHLKWKIKQKLNAHLKLLQTTRNYLKSLYVDQVTSSFNLCCNLAESQMVFSQSLGIKISLNDSCELITQGFSNATTTFNPSRNLSDLFRKTAELKPGIRWQYYMSHQGIHTEYPAHKNEDDQPFSCPISFNTRHREIYSRMVKAECQLWVIAIDVGQAMQKDQLLAARRSASILINAIPASDKVFVFLVSDIIHWSSDCIKLPVEASSHNKSVLLKFVTNSVKWHNRATNHSLALVTSLQIMKDHLSLDGILSGQILYASRGYLKEIEQVQKVLSVLASFSADLHDKVAIQTIKLFQSRSLELVERNFMTSIAKQSYAKYAVKSAKMYKSGQMYQVSSSDVSRLFDIFQPSPTIQDRPYVSSPSSDPIAKGLIVSLALPCFAESLFIGFVGMDIELSEILEDLIHPLPTAKRYVFSVSHSGHILTHPQVSWSIENTHQWIHMSRLENFSASHQQLILRRKIGRLELNAVTSSIPTAYMWEQIFVNSFAMPVLILLMKADSSISSERVISSNSGLKRDYLHYQRIDLESDRHNLCRHLKALSTINSSTLFISAQNFKSPFLRLIRPESKQDVEHLLAYLFDSANSIPNRLLKNETKSLISVLAALGRKLRMNALRGRNLDFIVRRYISSNSGIFQFYPGTQIANDYDPTKQPWYTKAMKYPGKIIVSPPSLDGGGAGYICSISHSIYEGKRAELHGRADSVTAVSGLDVTQGFLYRTLLNQLRECQHPKIKCFIMDERGYVVAHSNLHEPNKPTENNHIVYMEPILANDILSRRSFVQKDACIDYSYNSVERFYRFNHSIAEVVQSFDKKCYQYQVAPVRGSNLFLGIVRQECNETRPFCPCSVDSRICLNCERLAQRECECPCQCNGKSLCGTANNWLENCDLKYSPPFYNRQTLAASLSECRPSDCAAMLSLLACMGIVDCQWCSVDADGVTPLPTPFCGSQRTCFSGILRSVTPYNDQLAADPELILQPSRLPIGPVSAAILTCFMITAIIVYIYRKKVHQQNSEEHTYSNSVNEIAADQMDESEDDGPPQKILLATFDNPAAVSPYRVNPTYRRPTGTESDHGYSTMTGHDDELGTDTQSLVSTRQPNRKLRRQEYEDDGSDSKEEHMETEGLLEKKEEFVQQTTLPPHLVLASVTVHMVDC